MLGERVGGEGPGDPKKRSWVRKAWDWFIGRKHHGKVIVGQATSQREPDIPTISQAPESSQFNTAGKLYRLLEILVYQVMELILYQL